MLIFSRILLLKRHNNKTKTKEKTARFSNMTKVISGAPKTVHWGISTVATALGFLLNTIDPMPLFYIKGLFGFTLYILLSFTISYMSQQDKGLMKELAGDPQLSKCRAKYESRIHSNYNFILCFIACIYFVIVSIILQFVEINPIGLYSVIALFCVVFLAFIIFQHYIKILFLLYDISKIAPGTYYQLIPERTEWFRFVEKYSHVCRNLFILLGSLFIILFTIFSPINSIKVIMQNKISIQLIVLLCTWIIIILSIVFMIPLSSIIRNRLLGKIYSNLVAQSLTNLDELYKMNNNILYADLIIRLYDRKYTVKDSYSWIFPVALSLINYVSVLVSLIVDLKELSVLS